MAIKHFCRGVVRGKILSIKKRATKKNKKPFIDLKVSCPSSVYGSVEIRVRMYGKEIGSVLEHYKENPDVMVHLDGNIQIMSKEDRKFLGFQAMKFRPWTATPEDQPRASFIMEGICNSVVDVFTLHHIRELSEFGVDDTYDFLLPEDLPESLSFGDTVKVYGHFKDINAMWGGDGMFTPAIEKIDIRKKATDGDVF